MKKKNNSKKKKIKILPSILEEEEKSNKKIQNNKIIKSNIINAIKALEKIIKKKGINIFKEIFRKVAYEGLEINSNTLQYRISQASRMKYVKKIIPINVKKNQENKSTNINNNIIKKNIIEKNIFNVKKNKIILLKRKELKPFEIYENCKDLIDNLRIKLIIVFLKRGKKS